MTTSVSGRLSTTSGARELVGHEILVIDADASVHKGLTQLLAPAGLTVTAVSDPDQAVELATTKFFGVVIVDLDTPTAGAGIELVKRIHAATPSSTVIILTPRKAFEGAVEAFRRGASDVIWKSPELVDYLRQRVIDAAGSVRARGGREELLAQARDTMDDFLKTLMAADRRAQDLEARLAGRDPHAVDAEEEVRIICIDGDDRLYKGMKQQTLPGFTFTYAQSGGEALDRVSNSRFHIALVGPGVVDLPVEMIIRALKTQSPELITMSYVPNGKLEIVETQKAILLTDKFTHSAQLTDRLAEIAEAHRMRARERKYLQAFRERHYEFLRRYSELKTKLDRAGG
jgi:DNA-binding NtrC family response regulator